MKLHEIILLEMAPGALINVETHIKALMAKIGITVVFTDHFNQRATDGNVDDKGVERGSTIIDRELYSVFNKLSVKYKRDLSDYDDPEDLLGLIRDHLNNLNIPFALIYNRRTKQTLLTLKTIMKKKGYVSNQKDDITLHV